MILVVPYLLVVMQCTGCFNMTIKAMVFMRLHNCLSYFILFARQLWHTNSTDKIMFKNSKTWENLSFYAFWITPVIFIIIFCYFPYFLFSPKKGHGNGISNVSFCNCFPYSIPSRLTQGTEWSVPHQLKKSLLSECFFPEEKS